MRIYFVLYHEATLSDFLKVAFFHGHICEQAGDSLIELVDYCARKMTLLISGCVFVLGTNLMPPWNRFPLVQQGL